MRINTTKLWSLLARIACSEPANHRGFKLGRTHRLPDGVLPASYLFAVAQIFNLPYRRFVIGRTMLAGGRWQVKNLRYSRLQVCATGADSTLNTCPV